MQAGGARELLDKTLLYSLVNRIKVPPPGSPLAPRAAAPCPTAPSTACCGGPLLAGPYKPWTSAGHLKLVRGLYLMHTTNSP